MPLKLNKVDEKILLEAITNDERRLAKVLQPDSKARGRGPKNFSAVVGDIYFELGTAYYQQERDRKTVKEHLANAGHYLIEFLSYPADPGRTPTELERALALAVCFGAKEDVQKASSISDDRILVPTDDEMRRLYTLSLEYLNFIRSYLSAAVPDADKVEKVAQDCRASNTWKFDSVQTQAKLSALAGIINSDTAHWNASLSTLVAEHKEEATRGDYQRLNLGFIALPALLLAKLGIDKGMVCSISSPYLPLQLV